MGRPPTRPVHIACALGAAMTCIATTVAPSPAVPPDSGWGPSHVRYLGGVVCQTAHRSTALVSWPGPGRQAAFAIAPVAGPPAGGSRGFRIPAVAATQSRRLPATPGTAALAYLIGAYGTNADPAVVADVAAIATSRTIADAVARKCLEPSAMETLRTEAQRLAGPYRVSVRSESRKLVLGAAATVTAQVRSAQGAPVPGLSVSFSTADPRASLTAPRVATNTQGVAHTRLTLASGSASTSVRVGATVTAAVGLVQLSAPGAVSLITPDPPRDFTDAMMVPVDTTADPSITARAQPALLLPGGKIHTRMSVSGMRGHDGTVSTQVIGPLPFEKDCGSYPTRAWRSRASAAWSTMLGVVGDSSYAGATTTLVMPGCYRLASRIVTTNATPNVTRRIVVGDVITVPPVHVTQAPAGHGVALAGPLSTTVRVRGRIRALLTGVSGALLGPRLAANGTCPARGWDGAQAAAPLTATSAYGSAPVTLSSPVRERGDCYAFRIRADVTLPNIGSIPITLTPDRPQDATLVLAPAATVTALSSSAVHAGGRLRTTVSVTGTLTQAATLRVQLRHLANSWRGCFGRDWTGASVVPATSTDPLVRTHGDDTYTVSTPEIPTDGCWTPVPILTLRANPDLKILGLPPTGTMTAFTSTRTIRAQVRPDDGSADLVRPAHLLLGVGLMIALLAAALLGTWLAAHRRVDVAR